MSLGRWNLARLGALMTAAIVGLAGSVSAGGHHADVKIKVVQRSGYPTNINVANGIVTVSSGPATGTTVGSTSSAPVMYVMPVSGSSSAPASSAPAAAPAGSAAPATGNTIKIKSGSGVIEIDRSILATAGAGVSSAPSTAQSAPSTGQTYVLVQTNGTGPYQLQAAPASQTQSAPAQYQILSAPTTVAQAAPVQYQVMAAPATVTQAAPVQYQVLAAPTMQTQAAPGQYQIFAAPSNQVSTVSAGTVIYVRTGKHGLFH